MGLFAAVATIGLGLLGGLIKLVWLLGKISSQLDDHEDRLGRLERVVDQGRMRRL